MCFLFSRLFSIQHDRSPENRPPPLFYKYSQLTASFNTKNNDWTELNWNEEIFSGKEYHTTHFESIFKYFINCCIFLNENAYVLRSIRIVLLFQQLRHLRFYSISQIAEGTSWVWKIWLFFFYIIVYVIVYAMFNNNCPIKNSSFLFFGHVAYTESGRWYFLFSNVTPINTRNRFERHIVIIATIAIFKSVSYYFFTYTTTNRRNKEITAASVLDAFPSLETERLAQIPNLFCTRICIGLNLRSRTLKKKIIIITIRQQNESVRIR